MCQISKGFCRPFIIFLDIKSCSVTTICQGLKLFLRVSSFIVQISFFLIISPETHVELLTILGMGFLLKNIGSMMFSTNLFNVQLVY